MVHEPNGGIGCIRYRIGKGLSTAEQGYIPFINSVYDWIGLARRMYRWYTWWWKKWKRGSTRKTESIVGMGSEEIANGREGVEI